MFVQALEERNDTTAQALVTSAVRTVVEKASVARTAPPARRSSTTRSRRSGSGRPTAWRRPQLALLVDGTDAGDDVLLAAWCEALAIGVSAVACETRELAQCAVAV